MNKPLLNLHPLPEEVTDVIDSFFPRVYGEIDKDLVMEYMLSTVIGLAEYYLDERKSIVNDIKLVPIHFKWMSKFYTLDEMERLFLSIQLCETIRRYKTSFKLILSDISDYRLKYDREPTLSMAGTSDHVLIETT